MVVFSGDIGRYDQPILNDPVTPASTADVLLCESTYGDREHAAGDAAELLAGIVNRVVAARRIDRDSGVCHRAHANVNVLLAPARGSAAHSAASGIHG